MSVTKSGATIDAIPSGVEQISFLKDPVTDDLMRVVMELGAALWVERRRSRILERILVRDGVLQADALEQWTNDESEDAADHEELQRWMKRIYGTLEQIRPSEDGSGNHDGV